MKYLFLASVISFSLRFIQQINDIEEQIVKDGSNACTVTDSGENDGIMIV